jgi:PAS domain S-box-containing protein
MSHIKILYLEDLATDVELVKRQLNKNDVDYEMKVADSRESYINALKDFNPDILISDHKLPTINSLEALRIAKEHDSLIPVILITSTIPEEYAIEIMKEGASDYILKDRLQRLPAAILNAVEKCTVEKERQKYLDEIIASEALMREIEYLANVGSWEYDYKTGITKWSDEIYRILGHEPGEIESSLDTYLKFVQPEDRIYAENSIKNAFMNLDTLTLNYRIIDKDNNTKYVWTEFIIERNDNRNPLLITGFIQDVTEQKKAEETLKESELRFREFFENAPEAILVFDVDTGLISDYNSNAIKLLKYSGKELITKTPEEISVEIQPDGRTSSEKAAEIITKTSAGEKSFFEWVCHDSKGNHIFCEIRLVKILNSKKNLLRASLIDITERKNAERERDKITSDLIQHNKDLEQFAYIVSHNLRSPVANLIGLSTELQDLNGNSEESELIEQLSTSVSKLDDVIHDLNSILEIKKEINEKKEIVRFSEILDDVKISLGKSIVNNDVRFIVDFTTPNEILTIKSFLYSIFYNLISNSIKYRKENLAPEIKIESFIKSNKIGLIFKDNGIGIDLEKKGLQVFGLYKRFHTHVEGKGMGLFMVKTQVQALGGNINISSEVDKGTEFLIEFDS